MAEKKLLKEFLLKHNSLYDNNHELLRKAIYDENINLINFILKLNDYKNGDKKIIEECSKLYEAIDWFSKDEIKKIFAEHFNMKF